MYVFQFVPLLSIFRSHASLHLVQFSEIPIHMAVTSCFSIYYCLPQPYYSFSIFFDRSTPLWFDFPFFNFPTSFLVNSFGVWGMFILRYVVNILKFHILRCEFFELWMEINLIQNSKLHLFIEFVIRSNLVFSQPPSSPSENGQFSKKKYWANGWITWNC